MKKLPTHEPEEETFIGGTRQELKDRWILLDAIFFFSFLLSTFFKREKEKCFFRRKL